MEYRSSGPNPDTVSDEEENKRKQFCLSDWILYKKGKQERLLFKDLLEAE